MDEYRLPLDAGKITARNALVRPVSGGVRADFDPSAAGPALILPAPEGGWNLSRYSAIAVDVRNPGNAPYAVCAQAGDHPWTDGIAVVPAGGSGTIYVLLKREGIKDEMKDRFPGMNGFPGDMVWIWDAPDPVRVSDLRIYPAPAMDRGTVELTGFRALRMNSGPEPSPASDDVFPFTDGYGQYMGREWDDKINCDNCLASRKKREDEDLDKNPGPEGWNRYGGWAMGPLLKSTGHFRTEKVDGRWWLVDPDGRLFWSHGITCVNIRESTRIKGRERFFAELPPQGDPQDAFRHGDQFDFYGANLSRKYGDKWKDTAMGRAHQRLRSWGMNTVANWSAPEVCALGRTPYCVPVHYTGPKLERGFPDVRDPGFRTALLEALAGVAQATGRDPWCIGYFIDNELNWPGKERAETAEIYYRTCLEEMRRAAPDKLFLGSRIHMHYYPDSGEEDVVLAAAKYCDVVSFNRYRFSAADLKLPTGVDKPAIVGEWHFGALDRGMLHTGLRSVGNQAQRGATYEFYARGAMRNPALVGCHWFQYHDQCVTGRGDGENYQIGFLDIADTPYWETIAACRNAGYSLYQTRTGS